MEIYNVIDDGQMLFVADVHRVSEGRKIFGSLKLETYPSMLVFVVGST